MEESPSVMRRAALASVRMGRVTLYATKDERITSDPANSSHTNKKGTCMGICRRNIMATSTINKSIAANVNKNTRTENERPNGTAGKASLFGCFSEDGSIFLL